MARVNERRRGLASTERGPEPGGYDVVVEGVLPAGTDAAAQHARTFADAGAAWWVESRWDVARDTPEALLDRIRQGPPRW